jgi:CRP/FNR family transcriptional regulator
MNNQVFKHAAVVHTLRRNSIFSSLDSKTLDEIVDMCIPKALTRHQSLFCEGSPVHGFFVVQSGAIKLRKLNSRGQEQLIHVFRAGETLGADVLLLDTGYSADACATEPSQVLMIPKGRFLPLLNTHVDLTLKLLQAVEYHVLQLIGLIDDLTLKDVQTRLAKWLIEHCPSCDTETPQQIQLPMTKRLLASELGVTSETLSRTFNKFRQQRWLAIRGRTITVLSPSAMATWLNSKCGLPHPAPSVQHAPVALAT